MTQLTARAPRALIRTRRPWLALAALALTVFTVGAVYLARSQSYAGEALPGVRVLETELGGRSRPEAVRAIDAALRSRLARTVTVAVGARSIPVQLENVVAIDPGATADAGLAAGRESLSERAATLLAPTAPTRDVAPVLRLRRIAAGALVAELNRSGRAPIPARVTLQGTEPVVTSGRTGLRVHETALFDALRASVGSDATEIRATLRITPAPVSDEAALEAAASARTILSAPVSLRFRGRDLGALSPARLAHAIRFTPAGGRYVVGFATDPLVAWARPELAPWRRRARNARFAIVGERVRIIPSQPGYDVDPVALVDSVTAAAYSPHRRGAGLALGTVPAEVTTQEARALGIRRQVVTYTTDMGVSSANRIHNVHLMADYIDGTIVRPGQVFSFNGTVGPRMPERGFLEGQMILGSLLLPSIGGGVCQTATTLFNNAFELGLPIRERHNHSFYISHYPIGRDATVSWGGPDFSFRNDLEHALLIKASYTDSTLTFSFYGTRQGRRVVSETSPQTNFRAPEMSYAVDPLAPAGSARVVEGERASGFDVTVSRTVYERGKVFRRDEFRSKYVPQGPTTIYGPGVTPPGPYFVIPAT